MKYTASGFPIVNHPANFMNELYNRKAYGGYYVKIHTNSEIGVSHIHEIMWMLVHEGYILKQDVGTADIQFQVRLTMKGVLLVEERREKDKTMRLSLWAVIISGITVIVTAMGLSFGLL